MYVCMYVCCTYKRMYVRTYVWMYVCLYVCVCMYVFVCMYIFVCIYFLCVFLYMYICVYVCMYYIYVHKYNLFKSMFITISNTICLAYSFTIDLYLLLNFLFYVYVFGCTYLVCNPSLSVLHCTIYAYKHSY